MYKDSEISLEIFEEYNKLIHLLKEKNASSVKLRELEAILNYFNYNYDGFNNEEKKLIKNVIMISHSITNNVKNHYQCFQERLNKCLLLIEQLEQKKKETKKI